MRVRTFGNNLIQITRYPRLFPVNAYLVREDDGFTLIDAGLPGSAAQFVAIAQRFGAPIVRIVLTHAHMDHVGSLDSLHAALPAAEVLTTARSARFLRGDKSLDPDEQVGKARGGWKVCATRPTRTVQPGDRIGSLELIASPGHSPDHVSFLDLRDRTLIAGDAFQTRGGIAVSGTVRPLFPFPALATWHKPSALASARALHALRPARLAVGHGEVLEAPEPQMAKAIADAERGLDAAAAQPR
jgi:glyoxylase-like metal-dependent hydrolase (beta-lactamase superfamily II)